MTDDLTTRPMLEELLEGQRQLATQLAELLTTLATISQKQDQIAAKKTCLQPSKTNSPPGKISWTLGLSRLLEKCETGSTSTTAR
jgi:hypothetical protein